MVIQIWHPIRAEEETLDLNTDISINVCSQAPQARKKQKTGASVAVSSTAFGT